MRCQFSIEVSKKASPPELLARLRQLRGRLPADFHFNRLEALGNASQDSESAQKMAALKSSWRKAVGRA